MATDPTALKASNGTRTVLLLTTILAFGLLITAPLWKVKWDDGAGLPTAAGATTLALLYVVYVLLTGHWRISRLYRGSDGHPSTSKFQALVWTAAALFAYTGLLAMRMRAGTDNGETTDIRWILSIGSAAEDFPTNLLVAMGFSFTSAAAAKAITVSYLSSGKIAKPQAESSATTTVAQGDDGEPDLAKIQMLWWTFVAVGVYLIEVFYLFGIDGKQFDAAIALPDIDGALMVLMGLSHGVYIGKKLVTTDTSHPAA
jgi:hypothetical protein